MGKEEVEEFKKELGQQFFEESVVVQNRPKELSPNSGSSGGREEHRPMKLSLEQRGRMFRMLAVMNAAGLPLTRTLATLRADATPVELSVIEVLERQVLEGKPLSHGLRLCAGMFNPYQVSVVELGESNGDVSPALQALARNEEERWRLQQRLGAALTMPAFLLALATLLLWVLLPGFIFPAYLRLLDSLQMEATGTFGQVVAWMRFTQQPPFWLGSAALLALVLSVALIPAQREMFCRSCLKILQMLPTVGYYFQGVYASASSWQGLLAGLEALLLVGPLGDSLGRTLLYARSAGFCGALSSQLQSGGSALGGLKGAAEASNSLLLQIHVREMQRHLEEGRPLYEALAAPQILPPLVIHLLRAGEESGKVAEMCAQAARFMAAEVEHQLERALALLEPLVIAFLGLVMGVLALLMFYPITQVVARL